MNHKAKSLTFWRGSEVSRVKICFQKKTLSKLSVKTFRSNFIGTQTLKKTLKNFYKPHPQCRNERRTSRLLRCGWGLGAAVFETVPSGFSRFPVVKEYTLNHIRDPTIF